MHRSSPPPARTERPTRPRPAPTAWRHAASRSSLHALRGLVFRARLIEAADHVEGRLRHRIPGAVENGPAPRERALQRDRAPWLTGEGLRDLKGLGQEPHQPPGPPDSGSVLGAELLDPEESDHLLELSVVRDRAPHRLGDIEVL